MRIDELPRLSTSRFMHMTAPQKQEAAPAVITSEDQDLYLVLPPNDPNIIMMHDFAEGMKKNFRNMEQKARRFRPRQR